jgi:hypothetical protein
MPLIYPVLNYISPLENMTRPLQLPIYVEYYIDPQKYYVLLMIKITVTIFLTVIVCIAHDTAYIMCINHIFSLFEIMM